MNKIKTIKKHKKQLIEVKILKKAVINPVWLSIAGAAKLGGVQTKTIRRAIQAKTIQYKVINNRYIVDFASVIIYLHSKNKLKNKLNQFGIGQYVDKWRD